jgi:two-component system sensor histidine kinase KdpD
MLMRYGSRLAGRLNRNWYAVYVQTATEKPTAIDARTQRELSNNLALAQQLGATVFTYKGDDVVSTILQFAREYRVGHIVLGTPGELSLWKLLLGWRTVVDRLIKEARGVTIVVLDTRAVHVEETAKKFESQLVEPVPDSAKRSDRSPLLEQAPQVRIWEIPIEKEPAIQELIAACIPDDTELREQIRESVMKREEQGGTFIGEDIILPHTRFAGFDTPRVAIGLAKGGCKDEDSGRIAKLVILLISPEFPRETHVKWLGYISRMARDEQWQKKIDQAWTPQEVLDALRE